MIFLVFYKSVTNGPTDGQTDRRTDRPSYRDARTHLKSLVQPTEVLRDRPSCKDAIHPLFLLAE